MARRAFTRLRTDERRAQLLALAEALFATHAYGELSMARIAREAGISKALLYHYFPSKQALFRATLQDAMQDLADRVEAADGLLGSLDAYLDWIAEHGAAYANLMRTAREELWVRELVDETRERTAGRVLAGLAPDAGELAPPARTAVRAWLWFMDGACVDWVQRGEVSREELRAVLLGALAGALGAAGVDLSSGAWTS